MILPYDLRVPFIATVHRVKLFLYPVRKAPGGSTESKSIHTSFFTRASGRPMLLGGGV